MGPLERLFGDHAMGPKAVDTADLVISCCRSSSRWDSGVFLCMAKSSVKEAKTALLSDCARPFIAQTFKARVNAVLMPAWSSKGSA